MNPVHGHWGQVRMASAEITHSSGTTIVATCSAIPPVLTYSFSGLLYSTPCSPTWDGSQDVCDFAQCDCLSLSGSPGLVMWCCHDTSLSQPQYTLPCPISSQFLLYHLNVSISFPSLCQGSLQGCWHLDLITHCLWGHPGCTE